MKLLDTFITTSALYLIAYYGVLFFLLKVINISPLILAFFFGEKSFYMILIIAGCRSWDKVFGKKNKEDKKILINFYMND